MTLATRLKGLIFKNPDPTDPRRADEALVGGRREGENENPYLSARRTWNDHTGGQVASRRMWQAVALIVLMILLAAIGGIIQIGSQSKFVPYVIEVDLLGRTRAAAAVVSSSPVDPRVIHSAIAEFIGDARMVTPDIALQNKAIHRVYAKLGADSPARVKMTEWLSATEEATPFKRAEKIMVSTEIKSAIPQTPDTWQIDWEETTRDRTGVIIGEPVTMRALVTVYTVEDNPQTEKQIRTNPSSVYIRNYSWSRTH